MSIFNEDELVPPSWINQEFLQNVLAQYEKMDNVKLNAFDISPACLKGDHYGSIMFRCKASYILADEVDVRKISFVIKTLPEGGCSKRDLLENSGVFETESLMYSETLPKIEQILDDFGESSKMSAKHIYHALKPNEVIIMEDLCEAGYSTVRGRYLNENEMKMVYRKIAKFHAASHVLSKSKDREIVTKYKSGLFNNSGIMSMDLVRNGIGNFMELLREYEEFAIYLDKVKAMQPNMMKACMDLYNAYKFNEKGPEDIFVLNHGDFHMKNLMFKFNEKSELEDVIMVDYQLNCFGPSTIDTTYSQYHILSPQLRLRRNEFMLVYFTEFIRVLKKLNSKMELPLYSDFKIASYRYRYLALFLLSTFLPLFANVVMSKPEDLIDVDSSKFIENTDMMNSSYKCPSYVEDLRNYLPVLLRDGYLD